MVEKLPLCRLSLRLTQAEPAPGQLIGLPLLRKLLADMERLLGVSRTVRAQVVLVKYTLLPLTLEFELPEAAISGLVADLALLEANGGLDGLRGTRARLLHGWQKQAREAPGLAYTLLLEGEKVFHLDAETGFSYRELFVDAEYYLYGQVTRMGGKQSARIQIKDPRLGTRIIRCRRQALEEELMNRLYKPAAIHVRARLNTFSGKTDQYEFIRFLPWQPTFAPQDLMRTLELAQTMLPYPALFHA